MENNRFFKRETSTGDFIFYVLKRKFRDSYVLQEVNISRKWLQDNIYMNYPSKKELLYNIEKKKREGVLREFCPNTDMNPYEFQVGDVFELIKGKWRTNVYRLQQTGKRHYSLINIFTDNGHALPLFENVSFDVATYLLTDAVACGTLALQPQENQEIV